MKDLAPAAGLVALLALAACNRPLPPPEAALDTTLERNIDATGDGEPDRIALHLQALSSQAPVHWQLEIESRGKVVFQYASDDGAIDSTFSEPSQFGNCNSYLECKRHYYFESILAGIVEPAPADWDEVSFDASDPGSIPNVAHDFLVQQCGKSDEAAARIAHDIVEKLRSGTGLLLHVPKSPFETLPPMIYSKDAGRFVPISSG